jgi:hypothetical protein
MDGLFVFCSVRSPVRRALVKAMRSLRALAHGGVSVAMAVVIATMVIHVLKIVAWKECVGIFPSTMDVIAPRRALRSSQL